MNQPSAISQGLIASKSQISKIDLAIPSLELVSTHTAHNQILKVKLILKIENGRPVTGWTDSNVVLYWTSRQGSY